MGIWIKTEDGGLVNLANYDYIRIYKGTALCAPDVDKNRFAIGATKDYEDNCSRERISPYYDTKEAAQKFVDELFNTLPGVGHEE